MDKHKRPVVAIDIGGTKIAVALVTSTGAILHRKRTATVAIQGTAAVLQRLFGVIDEILTEARLTVGDLHGISLAVAGPVDMHAGMITNAPNLAGWDAVPLRSIVATQYKTDSFLINDAKAAALGEHRFGAAKGVDNMICVTLGTGIGGGIVVGGQLYLGQAGAAGEIGHMTIDLHGPRCTCGNIGCWELFASGTAMEKEAIRRIRAGERSSLQSMSEDKAGQIKAEKIAEAARLGDSLASSVIAWSAGHLGTGLVNLANIFNPRMIVLGGGLSKIGKPLLQPAIDIVKQRAFPLISRDISIVSSSISDDAGVLGAAAFAFGTEGDS